MNESPFFSLLRRIYKANIERANIEREGEGGEEERVKKSEKGAGEWGGEEGRETQFT